MKWQSCFQRAVWAKLALAAVSTLATLLLLEAALRGWIGRPRIRSGRPARKRPLLRGFATGTCRANTTWPLRRTARGCADEIGPKQGFRILLLGDSYTCGYGVERKEIFADRLREQLGVELINAGVGGFEIIHQLLYYRAKGRQFKPDLVVFALYLGNDLTNNRLWESAPDGSLRRRDGSSPLVDRHTPKLICLLKRSVFIRRLHHALWDRFEEHRVDTPSREYLALCGPSLDDAAHEQYRTAQELIGQLRDEVTASGAAFFVVVIPPRSAVEEASPRAFKLDPESDGPEYDLLRPEEEIGKFLRENGIDHLLLGDALREDRRRLQTPLYFSFDGHLNAVGHRAVAKHVLPVLSDKIGVAREILNDPNAILGCPPVITQLHKKQDRRACHAR